MNTIKNYMDYFLTIVAMVGVLLSLNGCNGGDDGPTPEQEQLEKDQKIIEDHLAANSITAEKAPSGYYYRSITSNSGGKKVEADDIVSVYYTISQLDGTLITSNKEADRPFQIQYSQGTITPRGLETGLQHMRTGEKFEFYFPYGFNYFDYSYKTLIPAYAILKIEIEVIRVDDEESLKEYENERMIDYLLDKDMASAIKRDEGYYYYQLEPGEGDTPESPETVTVHYTGTLLDGTKFDSSYDRDTPFSFKIGTGQVIKGWDLGLAEMKKGEKGILIMPSHLAYGNNWFYAPKEIVDDLIEKGIIRPFSQDIPPFAPLVFEVEVLE